MGMNCLKFPKHPLVQRWQEHQISLLFVAQSHCSCSIINQPKRQSIMYVTPRILEKGCLLLSHSTSRINFLTCKAVHNLGTAIFRPKIVHIRQTASLTPSQNISLSHVKRVLSAKRMDFKDGYTCVTTNCISCKNADKDSHLFINKITGYFFCSHCKACGSWDSFEKSLKSNKPYSPAKDIVEAPEKWASICKKSKPFKLLPPGKKATVIHSFRFKEDYGDVLVQLGTLVNDDESCIYIPLKNGDHIVGVKELTPDDETTVPPLECKGLITIDGVKKKNFRKGEAEAAVVVHSVRDLLALGSARLSSDVICLPHGVSSLPQESLPLLERYGRLVVWFGNGEGHREAAARFARKLDERRCFLLRRQTVKIMYCEPRSQAEMGDGAEDAVSRGGDVAAIIAERAVPVRHDAIVHFSQLRDNVLAELQNVDKTAGVKWRRFPTLNKLLKGHRRGEMTVLTGPSGAGKTTFISEYSLDLAAQGVTTLWGSFELKNERLARIMLQQYSRIPLDQCLDRFDYWADKFQVLPIYFMTFHGQQQLRTVMDALEHAAYVYDVAHVVIDNVQFMMGHDQDSNSLDRFYRQDAIIGAFRSFATSADCHVTLVIHPRKERDGELLTLNSVFGGAKATQEADNVLIVQHKTLPNLRIKKTLQIAKNRYSGDLGIMPMEFDKDALSFAQDKT